MSPAFERALAAGLLVTGTTGCWWLHARIGRLEATTQWRVQAVQRVEALRRDGADAGGVPVDDPFPRHALSWQRTHAGAWLCLRPAPDAEPQR